MSEMPQSDPRRRDKQGFDPETLDKTVIAIPLLRWLQNEEQGRRLPAPHHVVLHLKSGYWQGRDADREQANSLVARAAQRTGGDGDQGVDGG